MAYLEKTKLAEYVMGKHIDITGFPISPIKLQKTLYYLYAMWGGNARKINANGGKFVCENEGVLDEDLFEPAFEAWKYGPVDYEIYTKFRENSIKPNNDTRTLLEGNIDIANQIIPFIDSIVSQTSEISDFVLVDMTHDDECWKNAYVVGQGNAIEKEIIKAEYGKLDA